MAGHLIVPYNITQELYPFQFAVRDAAEIALHREQLYTFCRRITTNINSPFMKRPVISFMK
jgi:hypothetical protein